MSELISPVMLIVIGVLSIIFGGRDGGSMMRINDRPLVVHFANRQVGLFRIVCIVGGSIATTAGLYMAVKSL